MADKYAFRNDQQYVLFIDYCLFLAVPNKPLFLGQEMMDNLLPFSSLLGVNDVEEQGLPKVLGVLGHTRIPIRLPIGKQDVEKEELDFKHLTKDVHPDSWLNLELVCDRQGRFIHCRVSQGSEHNRASDLRRRIQSNVGMVPPGCCLVAGTGYPLTEQILIPYSTGRGPRENLFNRTLESHLCRLDQAVEDLKARFQRLKYLDMGNYDRAKAVVLTACILHNVFIDMGDIVKGQTVREVREQEQDGDRQEAGLRWRDAVAHQLYSALETESI